MPGFTSLGVKRIEFQDWVQASWEKRRNSWTQDARGNCKDPPSEGGGRQGTAQSEWHQRLKIVKYTWVSNLHGKCTCMYAHTGTQVCAHACTHMHAYTWGRHSKSTQFCARMYAYAHTIVWTHMNKHKGKGKCKHAHTSTDTQASTHIHTVCVHSCAQEDTRVHTQIHTHTSTLVYAHTNIRAHRHVSAHVYTYVWVCEHTNTHSCACTCMHSFTYKYTCTYACEYTHMHLSGESMNQSMIWIKLREEEGTLLGNLRGKW